MNRSTHRTLRSGLCVVSRRQTTELETLDTVPASRRSLRMTLRQTRTSLSVLASLGLLVGAALVSDAQEKPKTDNDAPVSVSDAKAVPTAKDANPVLTVINPKAVKTTKTIKLPTPRTDIPKPKLLAMTTGQDAQPPSTDAKPAVNAAPAAPAPPAPGSVTYSGLIDVYFAVNTRAPRAANNTPFASPASPDGTIISSDNYGRNFDVNDRDPTLSLAELNIVRTPNKSLPLGFTTTLTLGETSRLVHATEPGGTAAWSFLQQFYVSYIPHLFGRDVAIDFGTFVTPFGLEVIESVNNDNYSRAFNFVYGVPLYHAGFRATIPFSSALTAQVGLVNGWNNIADDNNSKSVFGQVVWKPSAKLTGILGFMGGAEGTGAYGAAVPKEQGNITTNFLDAQAIYQLSDKTKLAGWLTYGSAYGDVNGPNNHASGNWLGLVGYARHQFTPVIAVAGRIEQFEDMGGLRGIAASSYSRLREITLTGEYVTLRGHLVARLEYRHDHGNLPVFGSGVGGTNTDQDTLSVSGAYKF